MKWLYSCIENLRNKEIVLGNKKKGKEKIFNFKKVIKCVETESRDGWMRIELGNGWGIWSHLSHKS